MASISDPTLLRDSLDCKECDPCSLCKELVVTETASDIGHQLASDRMPAIGLTCGVLPNRASEKVDLWILQEEII
ncbi:unnamed protein product [Boreogadus saida]